MRVLVYMLKQDDPFKCTASKLVKFRLAQHAPFLHKDFLILNPFAEILLSKQDLKLSDSLCAIDCSWERAVSILHRKNLAFQRTSRRLPSLLAANPTNYSKVGKLSTAEALAASLLILGFREVADALMNKFKWGHTFFELNNYLLEDYARAENPMQIAEVEKEYFP
jgi:pre-rRNA-processing protein TSR3